MSNRWNSVIFISSHRISNIHLWTIFLLAGNVWNNPTFWSSLDISMLQLSLQILTVPIQVLSRWQNHLLHQTIFHVLGGHIHKTCNIQFFVIVHCVTMNKCKGCLCKSQLNTRSQPLQLKFKTALYKQHDKPFNFNMSNRHYDNFVCFHFLRVYTGHKI